MVSGAWSSRSVLEVLTWDVGFCDTLAGLLDRREFPVDAVYRCIKVDRGSSACSTLGIEH